MVHTETLRELSVASEARRARIHASHGRLPSVVWLVMLVGAALALAGSTFFVHVDDRLVHVLHADHRCHPMQRIDASQRVQAEHRCA